jgi:tRNA dimethylallyltransferase
VDPDFRFTAGDFCEFAGKACKNIINNNKFPLFVGGTAFYIDAFFKGLSEIPEISASTKNKLKDDLEIFGLKSLYIELEKCDTIFSKKIHFNDKQRILRGLEVYRETGKPLSSYYNNKISRETEQTKYIGLFLDRDLLKKRIDQRVDSMIRSGFIEEVIRLRQMGFEPELNSMQSIGYLELNKYIDGDLTLNEATEKIKTETKKYAKRQMTWFRANKKIQWFESFDVKNLQDSIIQIQSDWELK